MSGERRNKANKLDPNDWDCQVEVPMPKAALVEPGSASTLQRIETLESELSALRKKQDAMEQKQQDAEAIRRGQLDCLSERVFEAEKTQRQVQERTDDAIEQARAAFQKTASDQEHERINLMSVINQVNSNFEHLSREMAQVSDLVTRTQQDLIHLQQEVAERCVDDATTVAHQLAHLQEHHACHMREIQESQLSLSQQLMEVQCQLVPVMEKDRSLGHFRQEVGSYLDQLTLMVRESEAHCRSRISEQMLHVRKEVSLSIAEEVARQVKAQATEEPRRTERPLDDFTGAPVVSSRSADRSAEQEAVQSRLDDRAGEKQPGGADHRELSRKGRSQRVSIPEVKDPDEGQDHRLLEFLLAQDPGPAFTAPVTRGPRNDVSNASAIGASLLRM